MARARNIKPGLYKNEDLAECSVWARYIFPGMWMLADRDGRLEDRPKRIKGELLPYDSVEMEPLLAELAQYGFILRYEVDGQRFIQIMKFSEHQTPHVREQASLIPAPPDQGQTTTKVVTSTDLGSAEASPRSPDSLNPSSLIPDSLNTESRPAARGDEYTDDFEQAWCLYPSRPGASKRETFQAWNARLKAGVGVEVLIAGVRRYADFVRAMKTEPQYIKQPKSFFGPGEHYLSDWTATQTARGSPMGYESAKDRSRREAAEQLTGRKANDHAIIDIN